MGYGRDGLPDELSQWSLDSAHFCLLLLFCLKSIFAWYEYGLTTFFWLSFACHSFSILSLWALCLFLKLNCVSWRQHVVESCFLIYPVTPCLLIGEFSWWIQLPLGWSLIDEYLVLPFCLLFSGCSMSPFIYFPLCFCLSFWLGSFSMMFLFFYTLHLCSRFVLLLPWGLYKMSRR